MSEVNGYNYGTMILPWYMTINGYYTHNIYYKYMVFTNTFG